MRGIARGFGRRGTTRLAALAAALVAAAALGACTPSAPSIDVGSDTVVVDVRTPEEYADGHLEGAISMNLADSAFVADVGALDPDDEYVVYCRTGNRSAEAAAVFEAAGLDVQDAGGLEDAADATGLTITE